ncbi:MAG: DUF4270 family protein [Muribaculaceae bacterium]|nr:DUF4270 family protein [Muribaculaceae bacterium]
MKKILYLFLLTISVFVASCHENNEEIGSSLEEGYTDIEIHSDSSLHYSAESDSLYSTLVNYAVNRAQYHMLGDIKIPKFGEIKSDYLTELRYIAAFDTTLVKSGMLDSMAITIKFLVNQTTGDDRAPMQVAAYQMNKTLSSISGEMVYTNLNPDDFCDYKIKLGEKVFTSTPTNVTADTVTVILPISRNGLTSKEWAEDFFKLYKSFTQYPSDKELVDYLPGIYITHNYGGGAIIRVYTTSVDIYHRSYVYNVYGNVAEVDGVKKEIKKTTSIFVSTNEVESVNHMSVEWADEVTTIADASKPILTTPLGYNARITLPVDDIIKKFKSSVDKPGVMGLLNSVTLKLPVYFTANNEYEITPPPYLLLMRADGNIYVDNKLKHVTPDIFFYDKMLPDKTNFFLATYSSSLRTYDFGNIQAYITNIIKNDPNNGEADAYAVDSQMILVPVGVSTDAEGTITAVYPYLQAPKFAQIDTKNIDIRFVYSTKTY